MQTEKTTFDDAQFPCSHFFYCSLQVQNLRKIVNFGRPQVFDDNGLVITAPVKLYRIHLPLKIGTSDKFG